MLITLIRDNIPAKAEAEGVKLNATPALNDDLFANLLNERLLDAVSTYLSSGNVEALVEAQVVVDTLTTLLGERYKEIYDQQVAELGTYTNRYMLVQMQSTAKANNAPAVPTEPTEPVENATSSESN